MVIVIMLVMAIVITIVRVIVIATVAVAVILIVSVPVKVLVMAKVHATAKLFSNIISNKTPKSRCPQTSRPASQR